jgi:hypothetical protein
MLHMPVQCTLKTLTMKSKLFLLKTWLLSWVMLVKLELMKIWALLFYWKIDITYVMKMKWELMLKSQAYSPVTTFTTVQCWIKTNSLRLLHLTSLVMLILVNSVTHFIVLFYHKELSLNQVFIKLMFISLKKVKNQTIKLLINPLEVLKSSLELLTLSNLIFIFHLMPQQLKDNSRKKWQPVKNLLSS